MTLEKPDMVGQDVRRETEAEGSRIQDGPGLQSETISKQNHKNRIKQRHCQHLLNLYGMLYIDHTKVNHKKAEDTMCDDACL